MSNAFDLNGRTALVTGASRGIGRAIAIELGEAGARVGVHFLSRREDAERVVESIEEMRRAAASGDRTGPGAQGDRSGPAAPGGPGLQTSALAGFHAVALAADLRQPDAARKLAAACREALGPIDILVHNAGIWNDMAIEAADETRLEEMLALNLKALFHLTGAAVPDMKTQHWGRIVSISSTAGLLGEPEHAHYAAAKGGLEMFTRSLAVELGPHGITANSVAPGWTLTEMTQTDLDPARIHEIAGEIPTRRLATPEDVACAVRFLASEEARHVNGVCIPVEGGYRWRR